MILSCRNAKLGNIFLACTIVARRLLACALYFEAAVFDLETGAILRRIPGTLLVEEFWARASQRDGVLAPNKPAMKLSLVGKRALMATNALGMDCVLMALQEEAKEPGRAVAFPLERAFGKFNV